MVMKTCSACGVTLPLSSFPVRRASRDGLSPSCRECKNASNKRHYTAHKAAHVYRANASKKARAQRDPVWRNAWNVWRHLKEEKRVAPWAKFSDTVRFYREAHALSVSTGVPHEVDHIVPLRSKVVSGLHCVENLQVLTAAANNAKGSSFTP